MQIRSPRSMRIKGTTPIRNPLSVNKDLPTDLDDDIQALIAKKNSS